MNVIIDDGSNYIKVIHSNGSLSIPSRVIAKGLPSLDGKGYSEESFKIGNNHYSVTKFASEIIPTNSKDYQTSEHNRVLIHNALRKAGCGKSAIVAVTIPVRDYFLTDNSVNNDNIQKKADAIKGKIEYLDKSKTIDIQGCFVFPEGIPAFVYAKHELNLVGDRFLLIDIGGTTTDIAILTSDNQIEKSFSVSIGALNHLTEFNVKACEYLHLDNEITDKQALDGLMNGILIGEDVSHISDSIKKSFSNKIKQIIKQRIGESRLFDAIVLSGGGSELLEIDYSNAVKTKNPQFDNANGIKLLLSWF